MRGDGSDDSQSLLNYLLRGPCSLQSLWCWRALTSSPSIRPCWRCYYPQSDSVTCGGTRWRPSPVDSLSDMAGFFLGLPPLFFFSIRGKTTLASTAGFFSQTPGSWVALSFGFLVAPFWGFFARAGGRVP